MRSARPLAAEGAIDENRPPPLQVASPIVAAVDDVDDVDVEGEGGDNSKTGSASSASRRVRFAMPLVDAIDFPTVKGSPFHQWV